MKNEELQENHNIQPEAEIDNLTGFFNVLHLIDIELAKEEKRDDN